MANATGPGLDAAGLHALITSPFDRTAWEAVSADRLHVRVGRAPVSMGKDKALDALGAFLIRARGFGCEYCEHWKRRETIYAETDLRFVDDDGVERLIPCAVIARVKGGELLDLRFYVDLSPPQR